MQKFEGAIKLTRPNSFKASGRGSIFLYRTEALQIVKRKRSHVRQFRMASLVETG